MGETELVNARNDEYDVYIGRGKNGADMLTREPTERGWLGNPYKLKSSGGNYTRDQSIERFRELFLDKIEDDPEFRKAVENLQGKRLGRWCSPDEKCHGDVIKNWVEENAE
jgi:hypothetical protein